MHKQILVIFACLLTKTLVAGEPPASPRDGREAAQKAFIQRLRDHTAARSNAGIPRTLEQNSEDLGNRIDAALTKLDQPKGALKKNED